MTPPLQPTPKVIVMTDIHLRAAGKTIIGLDPIARFTAALDHALAGHSDAAALILMGDLTHSGLPAEYDALKDCLSNCPVPVIFMLGNHDQRPAFLDCFPDVPLTKAGHVQQVLDFPMHRIITLDTHDPMASPKHSGHLCADRLAWLREALNAADGRIPLVFAHHPPHAIGLPGMDAIRLREGEPVLDILRGTGAHLLCGHVHRTLSGQAMGVPFTMFKSPCHQAPLDLISDDSTLSIAEPGAFGLLLLTPGGIIAHSEDLGLNLGPISGADALPEAT